MKNSSSLSSIQSKITLVVFGPWILHKFLGLSSHGEPYLPPRGMTFCRWGPWNMIFTTPQSGRTALRYWVFCRDYIIIRASMTNVFSFPSALPFLFNREVIWIPDWLGGVEYVFHQRTKASSFLSSSRICIILGQIHLAIWIFLFSQKYKDI